MNACLLRQLGLVTPLFLIIVDSLLNDGTLFPKKMPTFFDNLGQVCQDADTIVGLGRKNTDL